MKLTSFITAAAKHHLKLRYNNHNQSFKDSRKINSTELSKAVWKLKQSGLSPEIRRMKLCNTQLHTNVVQKHATYAYQKNYKYFQAEPK